MEIVKQSDGRTFYVSGPVTVPLNGTLSDMMEYVKALTTDQLESVIKDRGLEAHGLIEPTRLLYTAASFIQNAWYDDVVKRLEAGEAVPNNFPGNLATIEGATEGRDYALKAHDDRLKAYDKALEVAKQQEKRQRTAVGPQGNEEHRKEFEKKLPELPSENTFVANGHVIDVDGTPIKLEQDGSGDIDLSVAINILLLAGYDVPAGADFETVAPVARGILRSLWYRVVALLPVPPELIYEQRVLYKRYLSQVKKIRVERPKEKAPAQKEKAASPEEKTSPELKAPKAVKPQSFILGSADASKLRGQSKFIYDAVVKVLETENPASLAAVITTAEGLGFATQEPGGNAPRARWLTLELVKKGILGVANGAN
ncbi:MAG TPA: hypothetical protein VKT80_18310 [Chloroflexota bacterium]|nr:hypothetical protein [Chloroflexota bacterium]